MRTVDLVVTGGETAAVGTAVDAVRRGQRVLVVLRSAGPRIVPRLRRLCRAAQLTVITNAEVVCVDGVHGVEAVVSRNPGHFRSTCFKPVICRRLIVSSTVAGSPPFSGFASAMTLEMSLAASEEFSLQKLALEDPVNALR